MLKRKKQNEEIVDSRFTWRIFRIMSEFVEGFQFLFQFGKSVTVFGSTRTSPDDIYYQKAEQLSYKLAQSGFAVMTGGGPGIMEAANKGASRAKGESVGFNIQLPIEQRVNKFANKGIGFHYFFTRKVILSYSAQAYVYFPGGFGTLDEFFEIITLIQTHKLEKIPVILFGVEYWQGLYGWLAKTVLKQHEAIDPSDLNLFCITDDVNQAVRMIKKSKSRKKLFSSYS